MTIAVSSWALHQTIGISFPNSPADEDQEPNRYGEKPIPLMKLPGLLKEHGFDTLELCHFHLPLTEDDYLAELKGSFEEAGVTLQSLLIDEGDPSHPEHGDRDAEWIASWIDVAGQLGAQRARIIAGKQDYSERAMNRAVKNIKYLIQDAEDANLRLTTENWFSLLKTPAAVNEFLDRLEGNVGLCADFGNWPTPEKYTTLPEIFGRAETCHAKCEFFEADAIEFEDYHKCLAIAKAAAFTGPFVIVNGGPADNWSAIKVTRDAINLFFEE